MKKGLIASLLIHVIILSLLFINRGDQIKPEKKEVVNVEFQKENKKVKEKVGEVTSPEPKRIKVGEVPDSLQEKIIQETYIQRLKAQIDPTWIKLLKQRLLGQKVRNCRVTVNINADKFGNVLLLDLVERCGWPMVEQIAIDAIREAGILPPPKDLLVDGIFYLEWTFDLKV